MSAVCGAPPVKATSQFPWLNPCHSMPLTRHSALTRHSRGRPQRCQPLSSVLAPATGEAYRHGAMQNITTQAICPPDHRPNRPPEDGHFFGTVHALNLEDHFFHGV